MTGPGVLSRALGHAAVLALLVAVGGVAAPAWTLPLDPWLLLLPGLVAGATSTCAGVWEATARRRSRAAAHARTWPLAALLFGGIAAAWSTVDLGAPVLHRAWLFAAVPAYGLAWLLATLASGPEAEEPATVPGPLDDAPLLTTSAAVLFALIVADVVAHPVEGLQRTGPVFGVVLFGCAALVGWWRQARARR